jgi:hypothetical protein
VARFSGVVIAIQTSTRILAERVNTMMVLVRVFEHAIFSLLQT